MPNPYGGGIGANIASQLNRSTAAPGTFNTFVPSTLLTSLVHRWPLDETSGNRADPVGGATLTDAGVGSDTTGPFSKAAVFVRANAKDLTKTSFVFPANFSVSLWAYVNSSDLASLPTFLACGASFPNSTQFGAYGQSPGLDQINAWIGDPYTNAQMNTLQSDAWHLFNWTYDTDNKLRAYLDAVLMTTSSAFGGTPYRTAQTLHVGGTGMGTTTFFGGKQAELLIHSVALTQAQIDEMYLAAKYHALRVSTTLAAPKPAVPTPDIWLTYGDSKTANEYYQTPLKNFMANNTPAVGVTYGPSFTGFTDGELAIGGSTVASMKALIDTHLASAGPTVPTKILCNLGINEAIAGLPAEATWESNYGYILDAMHVKWPSAKIYLMRPWGRNEDADCDTLATWIPVILSTRSAWAFLGPDERVFLKGTDNGVTFTADGVHPNTRGGSLTAENWLTTLGY